MQNRTEMTVPQALGHLRVALDNSFETAARSLGVSAQQAELLCAAMVPAAVGDLAQVLRCDRSNVSRLVDRAAERKLVRRSSSTSDGRVTMIELTPEGDRLARRFIATLESHLAGLLEEWPDRRQRTAVAMLAELTDQLERSASAEADGRPRITVANRGR